MPVLLYLLAVAVFAQGTSEFMLAGLLSGISADLGVSRSEAGLLTSAFAVGMVVGAPSMAALGRRMSPRRTLAGFLAVFVGSHVVGALTDSFTLLLVTRVVAALANAGFLAVALSTVTEVVPPDSRARALSVVLGGTTLALVAGVPAGALLGSTLGWRAALWAVAAVCLPALAAVLLATPARSRVDGQERAHTRLRTELYALRRSSLQANLGLAILVNGATFCTFTFLAPVATDLAGLDDDTVPLVLALFGVGAFVGVSTVGRFADRHWARIVAVGGPCLLAGWLLLAATAANAYVFLGLAVAQGALSFAMGGTVIAQVMATAEGAPTMGGSFATAALNVGAVLGPVLGGVVLERFDAHGPLLASAALVLVALLVWAAWAVIAHRAGGAPGVRDARVTEMS